MIHRHSAATLLIAALAAPLASQGGPPAMTLKTSDEGLARMAAEMFGHAEPLPELPGNKSWKLMAKGDGTFSVTLDTKAVSRAQITVNPARLMTDFAEDFANFAAELEPIVMASLRRSGLPEEIAAELFNGFLAIPLETQSARIIVRGNSDEDPDIQVWITPRPGSWLAALTNELQPSRNRVLGGLDGETVLSIRSSIAIAPNGMLQSSLEQFLGSIDQRPREPDISPEDYLSSFWSSWDGTLSADMKHDGSMYALLGCPDTAAVLEVHGSEEFASWMALQDQASAATTYEPRVFAEGDTVLHRATTRLPDGARSGEPYRNGTLTTYSGITGAFLVFALNCGNDQLQEMLDVARSAQRRLRRLGETITVQVLAKPKELASAMNLPNASLPTRMAFSLGTTGNELVIRMRTTK